MERPENMGVGICGIQLLDESGRVALSCARFPSLGIFLAQALGLEKVLGQSFLEYRMSESEHSITRDVDQVIGAFFVVRRRVFEVLGGFDERFFVYFEEVDFSLRAHKAGWRSVFLSDAHACHVGGGTSRQVKAARLFYSLRSRLLYGFKHYSPIKAWALFLITLAVEPWSRILFSLLKGSWPGARHTIKGYRMLTKDTPSILKVAIGMQSELD
jgi:GT2 family glycosyltransferase